MIAEIGMMLETKLLYLQDFSTSVKVKQLSTAKLHDDLERRVLHVEQQVESRDDLAQSFNIIEGRVTNLEQWSEELDESLWVYTACQGRYISPGHDRGFWSRAMLSLGPSSCVSLQWLSEEFPVQVLLALFAFGYLCFFTYSLVSGSLVFGVSVLHVEY